MTLLFSGCVSELNGSGFDGGHYYEYCDGIKVTYLVFSSEQLGEETVKSIASEKISSVKRAVSLVKKYSEEYAPSLSKIDEIEISKDSPSAAHYVWGGDGIVFNDFGVSFGGNCSGEKKWDVGRAAVLVHELCHVKQYYDVLEASEGECQAAQESFTDEVSEKEC